MECTAYRVLEVGTCCVVHVCTDAHVCANKHLDCCKATNCAKHSVHLHVGPHISTNKCREYRLNIDHGARCARGECITSRQRPHQRPL